LSEVCTAIEAVLETGNNQIVLLQCTTNYPSRPEDANIRAMQTMKNALGVLVGYSDHTQTTTACTAAIALGASVVEKHFTLDKGLPGPDQSSSYDPLEFSALMKMIREAEVVVGNGVKEPSQAEIANTIGMRRSIVAGRKIDAGEILTEDMVGFKRPAIGMSPLLLRSLLGRRFLTGIEKDAFVDLADLGELGVLPTE
jgi:N,N'-diacetyllegionaminate synthase